MAWFSQLILVMDPSEAFLLASSSLSALSSFLWSGLLTKAVAEGHSSVDSISIVEVNSPK
jgi:hypothetical protein